MSTIGILTRAAPRTRGGTRAPVAAPATRPAPSAAPRHRATTPMTPARRGRLQRVVGLASTTTLVLAAVAFLTLALGPRLFGYQTATMLTGSMAPGITPGDVIVSVPRPAADVAVGDVISYHIPVEDHRVETHRVVEVLHRDNGEIAVRTQGDANDGVDPWTATLEGDTVWELRAVVPYAGSVIRTLRTPLVHTVALWGSLAGLLVLAMVHIWRRDPEDANNPGNTADTAVRGPSPDGGPTPEPGFGAALVPVLGPVFDPGALDRLAEEIESRAVALDFARRFIGLLPTRLGHIADALDSGDSTEALDAALSLKVTSVTVGARELERLAADVEAGVRGYDRDAARAAAAQLTDAAARAERALAGYVAGGSIR